MWPTPGKIRNVDDLGWQPKYICVGCVPPMVWVGGWVNYDVDLDKLVEWDTPEDLGWATDGVDVWCAACDAKLQTMKGNLDRCHTDVPSSTVEQLRARWRRA